MRLSTRGRYSVRLMLELARLGADETPVSLQELAAWTGISRRYLEQLIIPLRAALLLRGHAGRSGGYSLTRQPAEVTVGEVLAAATGPLSLVQCIDREETCSRSTACECRVLWTLLTERMRAVLDEYSLADLADPRWLARVGRTPARRSRPVRPRSEVNQ